MYGGGLGEILTANPGRITSLTDAQWQQNYQQLQQSPGPWSVFQLVASRGWVPDTSLDSYKVYASWTLAGPDAQARAGLYQLWSLVQRIAGTTQSAAEAAAMAKAPGFGADLTAWLDAIRREYAGSILAGSGPAPVPPASTAAPQPDPRYPPGIQLLLAQAPANTAYGNAWATTGLVLAYRSVVRLTDGHADVGAWTATPANWLTVLPLEWRGGPDVTKGIYGVRWVGLDPTNAGISQHFLDEATREVAANPYNAPGAPARLAADTAAFQSWLHAALPTWTGSIAPPVAPMPVPTGVPYIPGSTVVVPVPGSGQETQVMLPGTSTFIPASQLTPAMIPPPTSAGPPPVVVSSNGSGTPAPSRAGLGLLVGLGLFGAVLVGAKKRRAR